MKEVVEAVDARLKAPYFGYALLAFIALNWRGFFVLVLAEGSPEEKLSLLDAHTDVFTLAFYPLAIGVVVAATAHWLKYFFGCIERKPRELLDNLELEAQHKKTIKQTQLEQSRSDLFAVKEQELIERAKRDNEVADIEDSEAKEKLIAQLDIIRAERDRLSQELQEKQQPDNSLSNEAKELLLAASKDTRGNIMKLVSLSDRNIQTGNSSFGSNDQKSFVKYEAALDELVYEGFVKELGGKGQIFEITHKGWKLIEAL
ncbi:hypothetical protein R1W14_000746 [Vibrio parahaemolyticus]|uniref:hypothetical protein n=1 Tax=Vibrio parahaemolyticus TaxID=670 RepID=UPI002892128D|nr:hypothetical protein [Vibrio parahaemolyticus]EJC7024256.1 hypothetical protein [Vibrio parahaemolyticus]EJC7173813.1 hypothetical protein [Vibrio parahaemolyticus]EJF4099024.1 hypothetical protein [Vibrio parahaemolyticus]EJX1281640.1 hypothetical protein [Vibrio parahaemolyticus]